MAREGLTYPKKISKNDMYKIWLAKNSPSRHAQKITKRPKICLP